MARIVTVAFCLFVATQAAAAEVTGKVKSVDIDKKQLVIVDAGQKEWTFQLAKDARLFVDDKSAALAELAAGQDVVITYEKDGERVMASIVRSRKK